MHRLLEIGGCGMSFLVLTVYVCMIRGGFYSRATVEQVGEAFSVVF